MRRALLWLALLFAVWYDSHGFTRPIPVQGAFIGILITGVVAAFQFIAGHAVTIAVTIAQAAVMIATAVAHFAVTIGTVFVKVYGFLGKFWTNILKPFVSWTWQQIDALSTWLKDTFAPIVKFIEDTRAWVNDFYRTYIQPVMDAIAITRQALQILERFGIELAAKLDRMLGELESKIMAPILEIQRVLNEALNWINRIVTLDGLLQRVMLLRSLVENQREVWSLWWKSVHRALTAAEEFDYQQPVPARTVAAVEADARAYIVSRSGPDVGRISEHGAELKARVLRAMSSG